MTSSTSKQTGEHYEWKKSHYQSDRVAGGYDTARFESPSRQRSNRRKFAAISKALALAAAAGAPVRTALDLPCGTGRIFPLLTRHAIRFVGADISSAMMHEAAGKCSEPTLFGGFIGCDAERLPIKNAQFDAVISIRFLFHWPAEVRQRIMREFARASRHWVIVDYRHRYVLSYPFKALQHRLGWRTKPYRLPSYREIQEDFRRAGIEIVKIIPTLVLFSNKWVILGKKIPPRADGA